jgi:FIMAH domain-containing protein
VFGLDAALPWTLVPPAMARTRAQNCGMSIKIARQQADEPRFTRHRIWTSRRGVRQHATDVTNALGGESRTVDVGRHGLASGQVINLLTEMTVGPHSFTVQAADHVTNPGIASVSFTIVVTPDSIKQDVTAFLAAALIRNDGLATSLLAELSAAADARARGNCTTASSIYAAFIAELQAQSGKGVDATAAAIMIGDAQYLIAHCP